MLLASSSLFFKFWCLFGTKPTDGITKLFPAAQGVPAGQGRAGRFRTVTLRQRQEQSCLRGAGAPRNGDGHGEGKPGKQASLTHRCSPAFSPAFRRILQTEKEKREISCPTEMGTRSGSPSPGHGRALLPLAAPTVPGASACLRACPAPCSSTCK